MIDRHDDVVVELGVEQRSVGRQRADGIDQHRERIDVDDHEFGGVDGCRARLGHDDGDGLTHEAHAITGQRRTGHPLVEHHRCGKVGQVDVGGGEHGHHARLGGRLARVDPGDLAMGDRGTHVDDVERAVDGQIVDVGAAGGEQGGVLPAHDFVSEDAHARTLPAPHHPSGGGVAFGP